MIQAKIITALVVLIFLTNECKNLKIPTELVMKTLNGKLVNQEPEINLFDKLARKTEHIEQRCEYLESQITIVSKQDYMQYLQKLEQKIGFLEDTTSRQAKQLFFLKIAIVIGLVSLCFMFSTNNQSKDQENQHGKQTEFWELVQPGYRNRFFIDI
jgi:hypothetical protein